MYNEVFVDTDGKPLTVGNVYVDQDGDIGEVKEVRHDCVLIFYGDYGTTVANYPEHFKRGDVSFTLTNKKGETMKNRIAMVGDEVIYRGDYYKIQDVYYNATIPYCNAVDANGHVLCGIGLEGIIFANNTSNAKEHTGSTYISPNTKETLVEPSDASVGCSEGRKYDSGKPRYSLLPPMALEEVVHVLTFGSTKYEDFNWLKVENANDRYFSAANRHLWQWKRGEKLDDETKRHHLASAITNLMFILEMDLMNEQLQTKYGKEKVCR